MNLIRTRYGNVTNLQWAVSPRRKRFCVQIACEAWRSSSGSRSHFAKFVSTILQRARTHTIQITLKHVDFTLAGGQCTANFMPVVCFVIAQKMEHLLASHSAPYRSFWCFDKMQMQVKAHSFRMWAACDCCDIVAHTRIIYNWRISKSRQLSWQRIISSLGFWAH